MHDLIIVGGGAAALAAAAYALDKQLDLRLVAERLGGKSAGSGTHPNRNLRRRQSAGEDVVRLLRERVSQRSELVLSDSVTAITKANGAFQIETKRNGREEAQTIITATGVTPIALDVPGGKELLGYGLGYSTGTHAQELRSTVAAAIGSTARAMCGVHELSRIASMVYWIGPSVKELISSLGMGLQYRHNVKVFDGLRRRSHRHQTGRGNCGRVS